MRFAYIDSNGNEVPIPSVDALALRIELGAITENTQLYDAQADQWGPAHTHEIYHTLARDVGEDGGFVAPPPVAPSPAAPPPSGVPAKPAGEEGAGEPRELESDAGEELPQKPDEEEPEEAGADASFGLTLAEAQPVPDEDAAPDAREGPQEIDDLPYLDLGPDEDDEEPTSRSASASETGGEAASFDFGGMEGELELEEEDAEGPEEEHESVAPSTEGGTTDLGGGMQLEPTMEFDTTGFQPEAQRPLDLEAPMSDFRPDEPPSWMEEGGAVPGEEVLDFSSVGAGAEPTAEDVPLRERRTHRTRPSPPKFRRQRNLAGPLIGIVLLLAVAVGGYVAWPVVSARLATSVDEEDPEVVLPPLSEDLAPVMRSASAAALAAAFEEIRSEWTESDPAQAPPRDWLAGVYLASAGDYGLVEEFWDGMADFVERVRDIDLATFDAAMAAELRARGIAGAEADAIRARADSGFVAAADQRAEVYARFDRLIDAALDLHHFLVANQDDIEYAPAAVVTTDPVLEVSPATPEIRAAMEELLDAVTRSLSSLEYRDRVTAEGLRGMIRTRIQEQGVI